MEEGVRGGDERYGYNVTHGICNRWVLASRKEPQQTVFRQRHVVGRRSASVLYTLKRDAEELQVSGLKGGDCWVQEGSCRSNGRSSLRCSRCQPVDSRRGGGRYYRARRL